MKWTEEVVEVWNTSSNGKNDRVLEVILTNFGPIINHILSRSNRSYIALAKIKNR